MSRRMIILLAISALIGISLIAFGVYALYYKHPADYEEATLEINGHVFNLDLADTMAKQTQGLSGRPKLKDNEGMLFIFSFPHKEWFWMYDMNFPLDIIWIRNGKVTGISADLPAPRPGEASSSLPTYPSSGEIDQALEINSGLSAKYGIQAGDEVKVNLPEK